MTESEQKILDELQAISRMMREMMELLRAIRAGQ